MHAQRTGFPWAKKSCLVRGMSMADQAQRWAEKTFGDAELGDERRTARLVAMAAQVARTPAGTVGQVFTEDAERQGAYDFLESGRVGVGAILSAMTGAAAVACAGERRVLVAVDGSSLTLVDRNDSKDFGAIGDYAHGGRGIKVISALAMTEAGVPLGLLHQEWWSRPKDKPKVSEKKKRGRPVDEKETQRWIDAINGSVRELRRQAPNTRAWFHIDREGDSTPILLALKATEQDFTVRGNWNRKVEQHLGTLRRKLAYSAQRGSYELKLSGGPKRTARTATMSVCYEPVTLKLRDPETGARVALNVTAILAREISMAPKGEERIDWLLLTTIAANGIKDALAVIDGYTKRWRIEEFHKTWKSGACNVEETQLRSVAAVQRWATVSAAVAVRIERLKYLSRTEPTLAASVELTPLEIRVLTALKRKRRRKNESMPDSATIGDATRWIAELGGYTGKSSGGPPGATVLRRGLERLHIAVEAAVALLGLDDDA